MKPVLLIFKTLPAPTKSLKRLFVGAGEWAILDVKKGGGKGGDFSGSPAARAQKLC